MIQIGVLGTHRRREVLEITLRELETRGRAFIVPQRSCFFSAYDIEGPPSVPLGWRIERWPGPTGGGNDFRTMVGRLDPTMDALVFEDDVQPCRNAVPAMLEPARGVAFTSFHNLGSRRLQTGFSFVNPNDQPFWGTQAVYLPASTIVAMQSGRFDPPHPAQDIWLGNVAKGLGLPWAIHSPSLVQHVGEDSLVSPAARLEGIRAPSEDFPGEDWDALTTPPAVYQHMAYTPRPRITWCSYHGDNHPDALKCPERRG